MSQRKNSRSQNDTETTSQPRRSKRNSRPDLHSSDEHEPQSQRTQRTPETVSENYDTYVTITVKFILNSAAKKYPVKRTDIVKECCNGNSKIFPTILPLVQEQLKFIYGIIFKEVSSTQASNKQYISVSNIKYSSLLALKEADRKDQALLFIILSYIFVKGDSVSEAVLMNFLERMDIHPDDDHEYFGKVKTRLETFRKQLYITRTKTVVESSNEEKVIIAWGERALAEYENEGMLKAVAKMFEKPTMYFKKQHMALIGEQTDDVQMEE